MTGRKSPATPTTSKHHPTPTLNQRFTSRFFCSVIALGRAKSLGLRQDSPLYPINPGQSRRFGRRRSPTPSRRTSPGPNAPAEFWQWERTCPQRFPF